MWRENDELGPPIPDYPGPQARVKVKPLTPLSPTKIHPHTQGHGFIQGPTYTGPWLYPGSYIHRAMALSRVLHTSTALSTVLHTSTALSMVLHTQGHGFIQGPTYIHGFIHGPTYTEPWLNPWSYIHPRLYPGSYIHRAMALSTVLHTRLYPGSYIHRAMALSMVLHTQGHGFIYGPTYTGQWLYPGSYIHRAMALSMVLHTQGHGFIQGPTYTGRLYTYRCTITSRMTSAFRWAAMRAILMFHNCEGQSHKTVSTDHNF